MKKTKMLLGTIILSAVMTLNVGVTAYATTNVNEIASLTPGATTAEIETSIKETANSLGKSEEEIAQQMLKELKEQKELSEKEQNGVAPCQTWTLDAGRTKGDIFYENSNTAGIEHGHVGIYWTSDTIVESWPGPGVRVMSRFNKQVNSGSKIFTLSGVSDEVKAAAADWAKGREGEGYSYNFANNRNTSSYGIKNCSKLVWAAYKEVAGMDIDCNGGLGVYPKDILNYKQSSVYKSY